MRKTMKIGWIFSALNRHGPANGNSKSSTPVAPKTIGQSNMAKTQKQQAEFGKPADDNSGKGPKATVAPKGLSLVQRLLDRSDNRQAVRRAVDIAKKKGMNPSQQTVRPISG